MARLGVATGIGLCFALASGTAFAEQPEGVERAPAGDPTVDEPAADTTTTTETSYADDTSSDAVEDDSTYDDTTDDSGGSAGGSFSASGSTSSGASASGSSAAAPEGDFPAANVDSGTGIDPFKGRLALGAIRTIAGLNGINVRYFLADQFAVGGSAGVALFTYRENDPASMDPCPGDMCELENTRTVAAMAFNFEALYFAKLGREAGQLPFRADFGLGGRFGIISIVNANDAPDNLDDPLEMHIEVPLVFQLMFGNNFSLSPEMGLDFRIVPGDRAAGDTNPGTNFPPTVSGDAVTGPGFGFEITPGVGLFAGASMHYIFGGR